MAPAKRVVLDFQNGTTRTMYAYDDCIYMDVSILLPDLQEVLRELGVSFIQKKINSFNELEDKVIMNCMGLGAKPLTQDEKLISVQGHLVLLKDQDPQDITYMLELYMGKSKTSTGLDCREAFYIFPKHLPHTGPNDIGVLGGTYIENADPTMPHEEQFETVLRNAKEFYGL